MLIHQDRSKKKIQLRVALSLGPSLEAFGTPPRLKINVSVFPARGVRKEVGRGDLGPKEWLSHVHALHQATRNGICFVPKEDWFFENKPFILWQQGGSKFSSPRFRCGRLVFFPPRLFE